MFFFCFPCCVLRLWARTEFHKFAIQVVDVVFTFPELCMTSAARAVIWCWVVVEAEACLGV